MFNRDKMLIAKMEEYANRPNAYLCNADARAVKDIDNADKAVALMWVSLNQFFRTMLGVMILISPIWALVFLLKTF